MSDRLTPLREQLLAAAKALSDEPLETLLAGMADDVARASRERLEIFPVAHHSPASAVHLVRRLREKAPRVIFLELCEDLDAKLDELGDCKLPVALQAFAHETSGFPPERAPLSVVAPLTEHSAELQAIAFAQTHPDTEIVFVDRSVDHVFQWERDPEHDEDADEEDESARLHGGAIGVEVGQLIPSFDAFRETICAHAKVAHWSEWWSLYVEQATMDADYDTYREVYFLVGSLIRRLGVRKELVEMDRDRERFMWTRMKDWLDLHDVAPEDALHICGAAHAASDVEEFGVDSPARWAIPPRTETQWLYGFIPSSHHAIEHQFGHPVGTITLAAESWRKATKGLSLTPFALPKPGGAGKKSAAKKPKKIKKAKAPVAIEGGVLGLMQRPPALAQEDHAELLRWCTGIVSLARKNGYLASTADAIAIYETVILLARLRARRHPSAYDFIDAAVTCLEKMAVPGKRDVRRLCEILLGGDRVGQVGYSSLPPLVQNVYDRLAPAGVTPGKTTVTRWLVDFSKDASKQGCSDLLWRLSWLLPGTRVARPIMGQRALGERSPQESWDIKLGGSEQRHLIELAYEGVTVEQVLERRLREHAYGPKSTTITALEAAERSLALLHSPRLTEDLGERAVSLLMGERGAADARPIFEEARRLVHYYRGTPAGLAGWLERFVTSGYSHYASQLPDAFADRGTSPEQLAAMLAFVFTLESLALSLGCDRSELHIALEQADTDDPNKLGLLWVAEWLLDLKTEADVRAAYAHALENPLLRRAFPAYLSGLLRALELSPRVSAIATELLSRAFSELPDSVLLPWLPGLLQTLQPLARDVLPALLDELARSMPTKLAELDAWTPPWEASAPAATSAAATPAPSGDAALLFAHRASTSAHAARLGEPATWAEPDAAPPAPSAPSNGVAALLADHPAALAAHTRRLDRR
ncbi:MAG: DUF5682 family protein [Sandaracinaceae bacterium]